MGHNTDFLTRIAENVMRILDTNQMKQMILLAKDQADLYDAFAQKRWIVIKAFGKLLSGRATLQEDSVFGFFANLYEIDANLSYNRALLYGKIANSLSHKQKQAFAKLQFDNSSTWPVYPESLDKRTLSHRAHVTVMTFASEFFSWYAGSEYADTYFCPERHGTYFGGFYLKDFPAMGNHDYFIPTSLTGDKGRAFIDLLTPGQSDCLYQTTRDMEPILQEIVTLRSTVAHEFRKTLSAEKPDKDKVFMSIKRYGVLDGILSCKATECFASIYQSMR